MAESEYRRLTCGACFTEFTQAGRGRNAKRCADCRPARTADPSKPRTKRQPKPAPCTECKWCGGAIEKPRRGKIYCGPRCSGRAQDGSTMTRAEYRQQCREGAPGNFTCEHCGLPSYRRLSGTAQAKGYENRWCSMACRVAQAEEREQMELAKTGLLATLRKLVKKKAGIRTNGYTPVVRTCLHCQLQWSALGWTGPATYCPSPECQAALAQRKLMIRRQDRRGKTHTGRAKRMGRKYRHFNVLRVFERDGWRCQLCGVKTPPKLRGTMDPRAPELDHIVPLGAGGDHLPENCQCACRRCNGQKGVKPLGQMLLVG